MWYPNYKTQSCSSQKKFQFEPCIVPDLPFFVEKTQNDLNCDIVKTLLLRVSRIYALREYKNTQYSSPIKTKSDDITNKIHDTNLIDELRSCQHILLDAEVERTRHNVFN